MKYYQNKTTNEIIGIENMREVISFPTEAQTKLGFIDYSYQIVYDMICPNKLLGRGITSFCITHSYLKMNYKRIAISMALKIYPDFKQYCYNQLVIDAKEQGISRLEILKKQTF